jgi:alpha-tubulin suppressor-like RCC1 family protein
MNRITLLIVATLGLMACQDSGPTAIAPEGPQKDILDGANGGNTRFFFLQPLVPNAASPAGTFDADLDPVVEICELDGSACGSTVASYTRSTGAGSETIRVDVVAEQYIANWHTNAFVLDATKHYRVRVLVMGAEVGHADVDLVSSGKEVKNVATGEYIPLVEGRTLPIKFRAEHGMLVGIDVSPPLATLGPGQTAQLAATATDAHGEPVADRPVTWSSSDPSVATVDASGLVTAVALGSVVITATADAMSGTSAVEVEGFAFKPGSIAAGDWHTCGLGLDGTAFCWGLGDRGQLGNGGLSELARPTAVSTTLSFTAVGAGSSYSCGLVADGTLYCWGLNGSGELGIGTIGGFSTSPARVDTDLRFTQLAMGGGHACALTAAGTAYCWGWNDSGRLGDGTGASQPRPVPVVGGRTYSSIAVGRGSTCAIASDAATYCWGNSGAGTGSTPTVVGGGHSFVQVSVGQDHACGRNAAGEAYCWGNNSDGQLGNGTTTSVSKASPVRAASGLNFVSIRASGSHTCGLVADGSALCWGSNFYGQIGDGSNTSSLTPVPVAGGHRFSSLAPAPRFHICGTATDGVAYCWGYNFHGSVGDGTKVHRNVPTSVLDPL